MAAAGTVEDYVASCPPGVQPILKRIRELIRDAAPETSESIRYGMPAAKLGDGYHIYFAAWKRHVGLYPIPTLDEALERDLAPHRTGKDTVRFLLKNKIPHALIERVVVAVVRTHTAAEESAGPPIPAGSSGTSAA
jgi:uncharacterized protein YdhG (YjbR/CyaY superfamily)